jgi:hypothetical protein
MRVWSWLRLVVIVALLAVCAWNGFEDGVTNLRAPGTPGQRVATVTQLVYAVCALLAIVALLGRSRYTVALLVVWDVAVTITAGMAPIVWGQTGLGPGLIAGAATGAVAALVTWGAVRHLRAVTPPARRAGLLES